MTTGKLKKDAVTGAQVKDGSLTGKDIRNSTVAEDKLSLRTRTHWAVVRADGTLARGSGGVTSASMHPVAFGPGAHEVVFPFDVSKCAFVAGVGSPTTTEAPSGQVSTAGRVQNPSAVWVRTNNSDGTGSARPFHLIVKC